MQPSGSKAKTVLTLDLARHCGWAFALKECDYAHGDGRIIHPKVVACGMIDLGAHTVKRFLNLEAEVKGLIQKHNPELIIIEENFVYKNVKTTAALNQLRGAVLLLAAMQKVKVSSMENTVAKKHVLGGTKYWNGTKYVSVTKDMMRETILANLCSDSSAPQDHDSADAIALVLTYFETPVNQPILPRKPSAKRATSRSQKAGT